MPGLSPVCKPKHSPVIYPVMSALVLLAGIMWSAPSLRADTIKVPAGDADALMAAISIANQSSETTTIRLYSSADYKFNLPTSAPEPISSHIIIRGEGAHLVGDGNRNFGTLFVITDQGSLELTDLVVRNFDSGDDDSRVSQDGLIVNNGGHLIGRDLRFEHIRARSNRRILGGVVQNWGSLDFDRVRIVDVSVSEQGEVLDGDAVGQGAIAIYNIDEARLQNLLIIDSSGHDPTIAGPVGNYILNFGGGQLELTYSSLISKPKSAGSLSQVRALVQGATGHIFFPHVSIFGSMIVDMRCPRFAGKIGNGFNLYTDNDCVTGRPNDLIGVSPGELQFHQAADGGLEIVLPPGSPALDAVQGPGITCPGRDAVNTFRPQDADNDGIARCDIGAFEKPAGTPLFNGGANGIFYSASLDGHYVTIQEVRPNVYIVFWNTFDLDGNQAWVWAMGNRVGDTISAKAFIMPVGMLIPGSGADVDTSALQSWGTVDVQLMSCLAGLFTYISELPQFGSGSFNLDRLTLIEGLGCQD